MNLFPPSVALLGLTVCTLACVQPPIATAPSNNPEIEVETLFTHDGCTVYRFRDAAYHYFVRCAGAQTASILSTTSCGKNCTRPDDVQTIGVPATPAPSPALPAP